MTRNRVLIGALLASVLLFVLTAAGSVPSQAASSYTASAGARLVGVDFTVSPGVAFDQLVDAGASVAQATIDSLGSRRAFASTPYPSESVVLAPGLIAGATAGQTSELVPSYPMIASSNETTPAERRQLGSVVLEAESRVGHSRGTVTDGSTAATARTDADDAGVLAVAESTISSIHLTPALSLDGIRTRAEARTGADGAVERSSSFEVTAVTVLGQRVALDDASLAVLGGEEPRGGGPAALLAPLVDALAEQGTTIDLVPAVETEDGVTAAGLVVSTVQPAPPEVASGLEDIRTRISVGFASASVTQQAFGGLGATPPAIDVAAPASGGAGAVAGSPSIAPGSLGGDLPAVDVAQPSPAAPPAVSLRPAASSNPLPVDVSLGAFYPVLVAAAAAGVGLVNLIRHLGVRSP